MAQSIFKKTLENMTEALRAEIARAFSSEKYLSDFLEENMVSKSEDQKITGFKDFDSVQIDHADIDTELVDEGTTNDLTVRNRLQIPLGAPQTRKTGDIWYDANITSPGGTSGGGATTRSITVHQESASEISMYDGSVLAASFLADNTINDITLDGKTIKIPKGVILGNMDGSDSINLEKNALNNAVRFTVKDKYIEDIADNRAAIALNPVNIRIAAIEDDVSNKYSTLNSKIVNTESHITEVSSSLDTKITQSNTKIQENFDLIGQAFNRIDIQIDRTNSLTTDLGTLKNRVDSLDTLSADFETRLDNLDGEDETSLKSQLAILSNSVNTLSRSISTLGERLNSISEDITSIKNVINSIHGEGTI